jgi:hypothetical protein
LKGLDVEVTGKDAIQHSITKLLHYKITKSS